MSDLVNETFHPPPLATLANPVFVVVPSVIERFTVPLLSELVPDIVRPLVISDNDIVLSVAIADILSVT
jgi:hypothetical protein